jgi:methylated-DNA-[protein]-cysteine S-methyltransferase
VTDLCRFVDSPLGPILLSADPAGHLTQLHIGPVAHDEVDHDEASHAEGDHVEDDHVEEGGDAAGRAGRVLDDAAAQLGEYFAGRLRTFDVPLAMKGSPFQHQVWTALQKIPFGTTVSYGQLATLLGRPGSARAVGHANGRNPIPVIVPCHRVIGSTGHLTGYGGGLRAKRLLLDLETGPV